MAITPATNQGATNMLTVPVENKRAWMENKPEDMNAREAQQYQRWIESRRKVTIRQPDMKNDRHINDWYNVKLHGIPGLSSDHCHTRNFNNLAEVLSCVDDWLRHGLVSQPKGGKTLLQLSEEGKL